MNKIKLFIASMLGAIALVFACVLGTRVNAKSYENGTVVISNTSYAGDTKTWDFKVKLENNVSLKTGDDNNGIYAGNDSYQSYTDKGKIKTTSSSIKKDESGLSIYAGGYVYIPVPASDAAGKMTTTNSNSSGRYTVFYKNDGTYSSKAQSSTMEYTFDSANIFSNPDGLTGYFLKLYASNAEGLVNTSLTNTGEIKIKTLKIELTSGSYGAASITHTVTYMNATTTLKTDDAATDGSSITYIPAQYGYDFEGWYTASNLASESRIDTTTYTVTGDVTLYANWTAWSDNKIGVNALDSDAIAKIATGISGNLGEELKLSPSIYTAMAGVSMTTTSVTLPDAESPAQNPCFNTNGGVSTTEKGLKFTAPADGTFVAYVGSGGTGTERSVVFTDGTDNYNPKEGAAELDFDGKSYEPKAFTFDVTKGTTYYLGGTNGVRIYYVSFAATGEIADVATLKFDAQYDANGTAATKLRFIGTIEGLAATNYANIYSITFTFDFNGTTDRKCAVTQLYLSITTDDNKYEAADNKMYFVYQLDNINKAAYKGLSLTNCKLIVVFTDKSSKEIEHADIELPATFDNYVA